MLARRLSRRGATPIAFPEIVATSPSDPQPFEIAAASLKSYEAVVTVGETATDALLRRARQHGLELTGHTRFVAVGAGAVRSLRKAGIAPAAAPLDHTPEGIGRELPSRPGVRVLIVHEESTPPVLAETLRRRGLEVDDVAAFRIEPVADRDATCRALGTRSDAVAFANPSAVRVLLHLVAGLGLDLERCLGGVPILAVGPETARELRRWGLEPDHVAAGRLADLEADMVALMGTPRGDLGRNIA
jgi:uroporphyrinogen-III synthase